MGTTGKKRLDLLLVERGFFPTREKARAAIMAGQIMVDDQTVDKPGTLVKEGSQLRVTRTSPSFVSRGGYKLQKALDAFEIDLSGKTVLDVGASTGGFTDCALQHGAAKVYAVDVGYGQLAWELRCNPRVVSLERTNIRYLTPEQLGERVDVATIDVSFISITKVLPAVARLLKPGGTVIALIKPQFEAGKERVGKKGVVRDLAVHRQVLEEVLLSAISSGFRVRHLTYSPIRGPEGNIEYLAELTLDPHVGADFDISQVVAMVVEEAHRTL